MTETEFLQQSQVLFNAILQHIESDFPDLDALTQGAVLEIENDAGHKVVVNQQAAMSEVWLASRAGGYHFRWESDSWINTRDGADFWDYLHQALDDLN